MAPIYGRRMNMNLRDYARAMDYSNPFDNGESRARNHSELNAELMDPNSGYTMQDHLASLRGHNGRMGDPSRVSATIDSGNRNISQWHARTVEHGVPVKLGPTRRGPVSVPIKLGPTRKRTSSGAKAAERSMHLSKKMAAGGLLGGLALGGGYVAARRPHRNQQQN